MPKTVKKTTGETLARKIASSLGFSACCIALITPTPSTIAITIRKNAAAFEMNRVFETPT